MTQQNIIQQTGNYFHLPGRSALVARRLARQKSSVPQRTRATDLARKLGRIPGVLAIYLTGSLAMANAGVHDDIDFMVITQPRRLWTTRLLLTLYTEILGLRRRPRNPHIAGKICLNLYLSPTSYLLPQDRRSLYTAYELIQAVPLYDPLDTRASLVSANPWIHDYLPNVPLPKGRLLDRRRGRMPSRDTEGGRSLPVGIIESLCYHLQLSYMRPRLTREHITPDSAFFHPHNPAPRV